MINSTLTIEEHFKMLEDHLLTYPMDWKYVCKLYTAMATRIKARKGVLSLKRFKEWSGLLVDSTLVDKLSLKCNVSFVNLMFKLIKQRRTYSAQRMLDWWFNVVATNQDHILTYLKWSVINKMIPRGSVVTPEDIMKACSVGKQSFEDFNDNLQNKQTLLHSVLTTLNIMKPNPTLGEIYEAWKQFALTNHPDKGGNSKTFVHAQLVFEAWKNTNNHNQRR